MANEIIQNNYGDDNIRTLEGVEHIRLRPGMYIGTLGKGDDPADGIYVLLKEVVDNSIDEALAGFCSQIDVTINPDGSLTPRAETIIAHTPFKRFGEPEELLGTLQWLASDASKFVTGTLTVVDGGFDAFSI